MEFKIGDRVKIRKGSLAGNIYTISHIESCGHIELSDLPYVFFDYELEPVPTLAEIKEKKLTCVIHTPNRKDAIYVVSKIPSGIQSATGNDWLEHWDRHEKDTCYYIIDGTISSYDEKNYFENNSDCTRGIPLPYTIYEFSDLFATGGAVSIHDLPTSEWYNPHIDLLLDELKTKGIPKTKKEEKKMPTRFTFYVKEGTRPDKKCNGTIPTMTTNIELFDSNVFDYVTTIRGSATCDKADYDERQGVLEALANAVCGGEFEKRYSKAVKANKDADLWLRTCHYCGQVLDTREEREAHEAWHVERKKARRERYLLRKRAKEIAFEEQAQKMAKEVIAEDNKK